MSGDKAPFVTGIAYALINIHSGQLCYIVADSAPNVWARAADEWGYTNARAAQYGMRPQGWRAKRVRIEEIGP